MFRVFIGLEIALLGHTRFPPAAVCTLINSVLVAASVLERVGASTKAPLSSGRRSSQGVLLAEGLVQEI